VNGQGAVGFLSSAPVQQLFNSSAFVGSINERQWDVSAIGHSSSVFSFSHSGSAVPSVTRAPITLVQQSGFQSFGPGSSASGGKSNPFMAGQQGAIQHGHQGSSFPMADAFNYGAPVRGTTSSWPLLGHQHGAHLNPMRGATGGSPLPPIAAVAYDGRVLPAENDNL
jgi:hypothetical protein